MKFTSGAAHRATQSGRGQTARRFEVLATRPAWQAQVARAAASGRDELKLWAAVLNDAIAALRGRHPEARGDADGREHGTATAGDLWREAVAWVIARDAEPLGTFESVCAALDIAADEVRRDLCELAVGYAPRDTEPASAAPPAAGVNDAEVAA